jgi:hypothetical protein
LAGGETTTFALSFSPQSTRAPSFATLAGVYTLPGSGQATMTIRTDGTVTFNHANGCVGNGSFTIVANGWNIYRWSLSIANCSAPIADHTASGLATLLDNPAGGTANSLLMAGTAVGAPAPLWAFSGTK